MDMDEKADQLESNAEAPDQHLAGIRGWLILPAIGLVLGPVFALVLLIAGLMQPIFEIVGEGGLGGIYALDLLAIFGLIVFAVYVATLFFRKRWNAPRAIIALLIAGLFVSGVLVAFGFIAGPEILHLVFGILVVGAAVEIPYFRVSKRVKATFVKGNASRLESKRKTDRQDPVGIGGWLILPAIGFALAPVIEVAGLIIGLGNYTKAASAGYGGVYTLNLLVIAGMLVFQVYVAVLFFRKRGSAPRTIIAFFVASLVASAGLLAVELAGGAEVFVAETGRQLVFGVIAAGIWIPYFLVSKRVKATFVR